MPSNPPTAPRPRPGDSRSLGPLPVVLGAGAVLVGLLAWSGALGWFGRLPGGIRVERDNVRVYVPLASMLLVSAALTLVSYLLRRFL
jgi:hypothetical protein